MKTFRAKLFYFLVIHKQFSLSLLALFIDKISILLT